MPLVKLCQVFRAKKQCLCCTMSLSHVVNVIIAVLMSTWTIGNNYRMRFTLCMNQVLSPGRLFLCKNVLKQTSRLDF